MKNNSYLPGLLLLIIALFSARSFATPPLRELLEYNGETSAVSMSANLGVTAPRSEKLWEMRIKENCSAHGGPIEVWKISDGRLWLTHFRRCGGDVKLSEVFDGVSEPLMADWVTGDLTIEKGKLLCYQVYGVDVRQTTIKFRVEQGIVVRVAESNNDNHPRIPAAKQDGKLPECLWR
jgi:hypothetical protein